jgi:hypothetical protein
VNKYWYRKKRRTIGMRKFTFLTSLLLLLSLLLAACGGAVEGTEGTADLETPATGFET